MSRPEGSKNSKTVEWEFIGDFLMDKEGAGRFKEILQKSTDGDFVDRYLKILEYFKPKLARKELTGKDGKELQLPTSITFNVIPKEDKPE